MRKYGLTCDNVLSFDVVTAEGKVLTASADKNADLFWALRGGGGNFGIVTSFLYRAHPVSTVLGGLIIYPRDQAGAVIRHYRDVMASAPEELTAYAGLHHHTRRHARRCRDRLPLRRSGEAERACSRCGSSARR